MVDPAKICGRGNRLTPDRLKARFPEEAHSTGKIQVVDFHRQRIPTAGSVGCLDGEILSALCALVQRQVVDHRSLQKTPA